MALSIIIPFSDSSDAEADWKVHNILQANLSRQFHSYTSADTKLIKLGLLSAVAHEQCVKF